MSKPPAKVEAAEPTKQQIAQKLEPYLRPDKREAGLEVVETMVAKFHHGPLPPPEDLVAYDQSIPNGADRIMQMAEKGQEHRHSLEREALRRQANIRDRGQYLAIIALMMMLSLAAFGFWLGQPIPATILGGGTLVTIVGMFLQHQKSTAPPESSKSPAKRNQKQRGKR